MPDSDCFQRLSDLARDLLRIQIHLNYYFNLWDYLLGIAGEVSITEKGDRVAVYSLWDMTDTENGVFEVG